MKVQFAIFLAIAGLISCQQDDSVKLQGYEVGECSDSSNWPIESGTSTGLSESSTNANYTFAAQVTLAGW